MAAVPEEEDKASGLTSSHVDLMQYPSFPFWAFISVAIDESRTLDESSTIEGRRG